jgi:hypothetical protein
MPNEVLEASIQRIRGPQKRISIQPEGGMTEASIGQPRGNPRIEDELYHGASYSG